MAPITNRSGQLVDQLLTNISRKYTPAGFVADQVLPRVPVARESGIYSVWTTADFFRTDTDPKVPDRAEAKEIDFTVSTDNFILDEYALKTSVSRRERDNAADVLQLRSTKAQGVRDLIALQREIRVATALKKTTTGQLTSGTAPSNNWNVDNATIEADIVTAKEAIYDLIHRPPNTIIIPWKVANQIAFQQDIREVLKYTVNGQELLRQGANALPSELWGLRVLVPMGPANTTSHEDASSQTFAEVWGDDPRVLYLNPNPALESPSVGYTLQTRGVEVQSWFENDPPGLERIRVSDGVLQEKIVAPDAGYEIQDVLS